MAERDYGLEAQRAAEEHLSLCLEAEWDEEVDDPSSAPFCGCLTCIVREVLHAAWPVLEQAFTDEYPATT